MFGRSSGESVKSLDILAQKYTSNAFLPNTKMTDERHPRISASKQPVTVSHWVNRLVSQSMTSEEKNYISPQPAEACPIINDIIKAVIEIENMVKSPRYRERDLEESETIISDVEWAIGGVETRIEEVRTRIEDVRAWGQEWKDLAKSLIG